MPCPSANCGMVNAYVQLRLSVGNEQTLESASSVERGKGEERKAYDVGSFIAALLVECLFMPQPLGFI